MNTPGPEDTAAVRTSVVRMTASALVILGVYAVVPVSSAQDSTSVLVLVGGLALLGGIVVVRAGQIRAHPRPALRASEVLALVVPSHGSWSRPRSSST